jgi:hypothetical protein
MISITSQVAAQESTAATVLPEESQACVRHIWECGGLAEVLFASRMNSGTAIAPTAIQFA